MAWTRVSNLPGIVDKSIYAELYDMPYGPGGGDLALGNIQRTTIQALRKAKYGNEVEKNVADILNM